MEALREIKELVQQQGQAWEEFKKQNDARIAVLEKGGTGSDYDAKLASINTALDELKSALKDVETKRNRIDLPGVGGENDPEYKTAFVGFVRKGANEHELREKAVNTGSDADGGIAVPQEVDRNILQLLGRETPMREVADVITVSTEDYKKIVNLGGTGSGWVGETDQRPGTTNSKLAAIASYFGEIYANPAATQRSLDDLFFDVEAWISSEVVKEFTEQENAAFTGGDGEKKPKGFLAYDVDNKRDVALRGSDRADRIADNESTHRPPPSTTSIARTISVRIAPSAWPIEASNAGRANGCARICCVPSSTKRQ